MQARPGRVEAAETVPLTVATSTGRHDFKVEVVATPEDRAMGLMYRKSVPEGTGMLFDFQYQQPVSFWMKNTYVSLDMIFIRENGAIARIAPRHHAAVGKGRAVGRPCALRAGSGRGHRENG